MSAHIRSLSLSAAAAITATVIIPVAVQQKWFDSNRYVLPLLISSVFILLVCAAGTSRRASGLKERYPVASLVIFVVVGTLLGGLIGYACWWAVGKSGIHLDEITKGTASMAAVPAQSSQTVMFNLPSGSNNTFVDNIMITHKDEASQREAMAVWNADRERRHKEQGVSRTLSPNQRFSITAAIAPLVVARRRAGKDPFHIKVGAATRYNTDYSQQVVATLKELGLNSEYYSRPESSVSQYAAGAWLLCGRKRTAELRAFDTALLQGLRDAGLIVQRVDQSGSNIELIFGSR